MMTYFSNVYKNRFKILKSLDKPKLGWLSIYTPEEIIYAAGLIPYRITGETKPNFVKSSGYMHRNICPYVLSCFEEALEDVHNFSDGVIIQNSCDARRKLYDLWKYYIKTKVIHFIDFPRSVSRESKKYFRDQIKIFIETLEKIYNCKITDNLILESIELFNETRSLLQQLYNFRKEYSPAITGSQSLIINKTSMMGLRKEFNFELSKLLDFLNLKKTVEGNKDRPRILICGSYFDHIEIIDLLENIGADVVCEDISNSIKYFEGNVDINNDPVSALADYYLSKATYARMIDSEKRFNHLWNLVCDYKVQSVIYFSLKFCDNNLIDFPYQKKKLNEKGIPVLFLEIERSTTNIEQLKTRIQTFIETL